MEVLLFISPCKPYHCATPKFVIDRPHPYRSSSSPFYLHSSTIAATIDITKTTTGNHRFHSRPLRSPSETNQSSPSSADISNHQFPSSSTASTSSHPRHHLCPEPSPTACLSPNITPIYSSQTIDHSLPSAPPTFFSPSAHIFPSTTVSSPSISFPLLPPASTIETEVSPQHRPIPPSPVPTCNPTQSLFRRLC